MSEFIQNIYGPAKLLAAFREEEKPDATFSDPIPSAHRNKNQNQ